MSMIEFPGTLNTPMNEQMLVSRLRPALQATVFNSRRLITPRRIGQIAEEAATSFMHYANGITDDAAIRAFGLRLANDGLGHTTALAMVDAFHELIWEQYRSGMIDQPLSMTYGSAFLAGYMAGREATLLEEQERARIGYNRAQANLTT